MSQNIQGLVPVANNWTILAKVHGYEETMYNDDIEKKIGKSLGLDIVSVVKPVKLAKEYKKMYPRGSELPVIPSGMSVFVSPVPKNLIQLADYNNVQDPLERALFHVRSFTETYSFLHNSNICPMLVQWNKSGSKEPEKQAAFTHMTDKCREVLAEGDTKFRIRLEPCGCIDQQNGFQRSRSYAFSKDELMIQMS